MAEPLIEIVQNFGILTVEVIQPQTVIFDVQTLSNPVIEISSIGVQGPQGVSSDSEILIASVPISALRAIRKSTTNNALIADNLSVATLLPVIGISINAASVGQNITVRTLGEFLDASFNFVVGQPVYIGTNGVISTTPPSGIIAVIGWATSATSLTIRPETPVL